MFDGIAEHEGRKTRLPSAICFTKLLFFFLLFLSNLFLLNDLIKKNVKSCFDVLLVYYFSRTRTAYRFCSLVFCTYTLLLGNLKIHYECGRVVRALDSGSDVRVFNPNHRQFLFLCQIFVFNYNIHYIFSILIFHK